MKILFVTILMGFGLLMLIIFIDIIMGTSTKGVIWKALNPFRVMEPAEYMIIFIFVFYFFFSVFTTIRKKTKKPTSN